LFPVQIESEWTQPTGRGDSSGEESNGMVEIRESGAPRGARLLVVWDPQKQPAETEEGLQVALGSKLATTTGPGSASTAAARATPANAVGQLHERSIYGDCVRLLEELLRCGLRFVCFGQSRNAAELIYRLLEQRRRHGSAGLGAKRVGVYRGGYTAAERRQIEGDLFAGRLDGMVATNALELGLDVGRLDCTVMVGYPGSESSLRQQLGRSGRGERASLGILLLYEDGLHRYWAEHPDELWTGGGWQRRWSRPLPLENARLWELHLPVAAAEQELRGPPATDEMWPGDGQMREVLDRLLADGRLQWVDEDRTEEEQEQEQEQDEEDMFGEEGRRGRSRELESDGERTVPSTPVRSRAGGGRTAGQGGRPSEGRRLRYAGKERRPAMGFGLRGSEGERYQVVLVVEEEGGGEQERWVESLEAWACMMRAHVGAVYLYRGESYLVVRVEEGRRRVLLRGPVRPKLNYYTEPVDRIRVTMRRERAKAGYPLRGDGAAGQAAVHGTGWMVYGELHVERWIPYYRKRGLHGAILERVRLESEPRVTMETEGLCLSLARWMVRRLEGDREPGGCEEESDPRSRSFRTVFAAQHALEHVMRTVAPLVVESSSGSDLQGCGCEDANLDEMHPRMYLYDGLAGGSGLCRALYARRAVWLRQAEALLMSCGCASQEDRVGGGLVEGDARRERATVLKTETSGRRAGCVRCTFRSDCGERNEKLDRDGALLLVQGMLDGAHPKEEEGQRGEQEI
jgi:ATP-dependent helicase YprA (DUF1998 family)